MPVPKDKKGLTVKQRAFVLEYLVDTNATQAAIRAGYSERTAHAIGAENIAKPHIAAHIKKELAAREKRIIADGDWVLRKIQLVAERCLEEKEVLDDNGNPIGVFLFDAANASRALELLGKHHRLFIERHEVSVTIQAAIEFVAKINSVIVHAVKDESVRDEILQGIQQVVQSEEMNL